MSNHRYLTSDPPSPDHPEGTIYISAWSPDTGLPAGWTMDMWNELMAPEGSNGDDTLVGDRADNVIYGGDGKDTLKGGRGDDHLEGCDGADTLIGGSGDDYLDGGKGNDQLTGGAGKDLLEGGKGNDKLDGGAGHDSLSGGKGNDRLTGGKGNDELSGGAGKDKFMYGAGGFGDDMITDFQDGRDKIVMAGRSFDDLTISDEMSQNGGSFGTIIEVGNSSIMLHGVNASDITAADFVFV